MEYYSKCNVCGKISCYTDVDLKENTSQQIAAGLTAIASIGNAFAGTRYDMYEMGKASDRASNRVVDYSKCPECGSKDVVLVTKKFAVYHNKNNNKYSAKDLIEEAKKFLEKKDFENAFCFANMAYLEDDELYDTYLIKLLASFEIIKLEMINSLNIDYSDNQHYINLLEHSNASQKEKLNKMYKEFLISQGELLLEQPNSIELNEKINNVIDGFNDHNINNSKLIEKLQNKVIDISYWNACNLLDSNNEIDISKAKDIFLKLEDYKESKKKKIECEEKIELIRSNRKKDQKRRRCYIIIVLIIAIVIGISIFLLKYINEDYIPNKNYDEAKQLISEEKYQEAIKILDGLSERFRVLYINTKDNIYTTKRNDVLIMLENSYEKYAEKLLNDNKIEEALEIISKIENSNITNRIKYAYVKKYFDNTNDLTYQYLKGLAAAKYEDSLELYKELFKIEGYIIVNTDKDDNNTSMNEISTKNRTFYIHYGVNGSLSNQKVPIRIKIEYKNNNLNSSIWKTSYFGLDEKDSIQQEIGNGDVHILEVNGFYNNLLKISLYNVETDEIITSTPEINYHYF